VERELLMTGIGGQGVQLGARIVADAAVLEGREVMLFGVYGGAMRGGNTDSTIVFGDAPITAPPVVSSTWSAIAMHHEFWAPVRDKLRPNAVVLVNSTLFEGDPGCDPERVIEIPATAIASKLGNPLGGSLVMVGAYAAVTGVVRVDSLVAAMEQALPSYRREHAPANEAALRAGFDAAPAGVASAWGGSV
jgi:Pyruvate/2-oxoacid:ferredoxin oxidoreductase gamma subunit